ncbi:MAG: hypothetical protein A2W33_09345 [Chloroflexi bacterium RBG_16_52_11]|nr:MAG: hypothetical protein A2W33_09345 [Chloroflexi bacterium RBG_16_52_11]
MQENAVFNLRVLWKLFGGVMLLMAANIVDHIAGKPLWGITRFIDLGSDTNVSAWYSSILLTVAGLISYECSVYAKRENVPGSFLFLLFAGLLFFMSCDEVATIHEIVGKYLAEYFDISSKNFAKHAPWVWVGGPVIITVFVVFLFLFKKLFSLVPRSMVFLSSGFALIILGGIVLESTINFLNHEELQWIWNLEVILEESLEMVGTLFISYSLIVWRDGIVRLSQ